MNLTIPNLLSLLRMGIIPLFVIAILDRQPGKALLLFVIAGVTDALDGLIARFWNQSSALGMYLDPMADKLLLVTAYVMLSVPSLNPVSSIPVWVTVLVIARDVLIVVVALVLHIAQGVGRFPPSLLSKINTVLQVSTVIVVLAAASWRGLESLATGLSFAVALFTVLSGVDYTLHINRLAKAPGAEVR